MSRAFLTPIGAAPLESNPASGTAGDIYYNSGDQTIRYYNGSSWVSIAVVGNLTSYAPLASPTFTGTVTAPVVSISGGTLYLQRVSSSLEGGEIQFNRSSDNTVGWTIDAYGSGTQPALRFFDAGGNVRVTLDANGKFVTTATSTTSAGINIPHGTAPTSPVNGDVWTTTAGMYVRINGSTVGPLSTGSGGTADPTFTGTVTAPIFAATSNGLGTNFKVGDDVWIGDINLANTLRITGQQSGLDGYIVFGNADATALGRSGTGALTYGGNTIWHAGNDGAGSGLDADTIDGIQASALATVASPTFTGVPAAPTAAVDTNTTQVATTAYVVGQGYLKSATASSTYAPLSSPALTGTPTAPTAAAGTNTTQVATTAYVRGEVSALVASAPAALDTLNELATALGNDANFSTTVTNSLALKAPLASPTFTGTVSLPTTNISGVATFSNYLNRVTANGNSSWLQQDGTGRVHWYWNTLGGTSPTFTNAAEDASALTMHITGTSAGGSFFHRSASGVGKNAGDAITWTTTLYVDLNSITYKNNTIWHAGNDGAGSGLDADTVDGIQASALAALASPTFTGVPAAPTATADTNTTQLATTAFVVGQAGSATPVVNGTAAVGTSLRYARQDHVHGTDTTRAPLASPAFTGTITGASLNLSAEIQSEAGTKDDLTTRTKSGFWQTSSATTAEGWPETSNSWAHLISSTHSNTGNYYALQIAASFYSTDSVYVRVTNGSGTAPWKRMLHEGNTAHIHPFMLSCI